MTLAERLVRGLRVPEDQDGYHFERAVIANVDEALLWIENWWSPCDGFWLRREMTESKKLEAARHWLWLRWLYRERIAERGGRS